MVVAVRMVDVVLSGRRIPGDTGGVAGSESTHGLHLRLPAAEDLHKHRLELVAKQAVYQDVDTRVDSDTQVGNGNEFVIPCYLDL